MKKQLPVSKYGRTEAAVNQSVTGWKHGKGVYERWRYGRAFFVGCAIAKAYCSVEIRSDGTDFGKFVYGGGSVKGYFAFLKKEFFEYTKPINYSLC